MSSSLTEVAQELGVSKATVSQIRAGKYHGNKETEDRISAVLTERGLMSADEAAPEPVITGFETEGQRLIRATLAATLESREFSLITAPSGVGKTHSARRYKAETPGVWYYKVQKSLSVSGMTRVLCDLWQLRTSGSNEQRLLRLMDAVKAGVARMLILDEVDLFIDPRRPTSFLDRLEICRELYEAGLAVALVGLPELETAIRAETQSYVWSRLGYYAPVMAPAPDEVFAFCRQAGIQQVQEVANRANRRGYFRYVSKVAERAQLVGEEAALGLVYLGEPGRKPQ
jgi:DNA transposition AAA+ family ATPase